MYPSTRHGEEACLWTSQPNRRRRRSLGFSGCTSRVVALLFLSLFLSSTALTHQVRAEVDSSSSQLETCESREERPAAVQDSGEEGGESEAGGGESDEVPWYQKGMAAISAQASERIESTSQKWNEGLREREEARKSQKFYHSKRRCKGNNERSKPCQRFLNRILWRKSSALLNLYKAFYDARGSQKKIGVTLPGLRNMNEDFVGEGKRLSDEDVEKMVGTIESYKSKQPRKPIGLFKGRGIAIVGGDGMYQTPFWVAVHAIRRTGCTLPIEIWFPHKELPSCHRIAELGKLDVTVRSFSELANQNPGDQDFELHSFMYKIFALVFSSFEEVLLLDSDIVAVKDPEFLFDAPEYKDHGTLLWKDFWNSSSAPDCQRILGERTALSFTHESGQMLVHKSRKWDALMLALYMNSFPKFFYPLSVNYMGWGDKEILAFAILSLGEDYGIVEDGPDHVGIPDPLKPGVIGNTMMQHDPSGLPLFMHANLGKMSTHLPYKERFYKRRWQISLVHGEGLIDVVAEHAGVDLEMWIYDLIVSNRCLFDSNEFQGLPKRQLGMAITDHPNLNNDITAVKVLESEGYLMYQEATLSPDTVLLRDKLADFAAEWE